MRLTKHLALAPLGNAFLIPGDVNGLSVDPMLKSSSISQPSHQDIELACSSCPYALNSQRNGHREWTNNVASNLKIMIDSDGANLRLNGVSFYPLQVPGIPPTLHVAQHKNNDELSSIQGFEGDLRLSYSLEFDEKKADDGSSLVTVVVTLMGLEDQMIRVDNVQIKAIREGSGNLILHSASGVPVSPDSSDARCENIACRAFTKIIAGVQKAKTAAKSAGRRVKCFCVQGLQHLTSHPNYDHERPSVHHLPDGTVKLPSHFKVRPGMAGGRGPHHGHHHDFVQRVAHVMWAIVRMAFVPILIGIAFGMAASAVGMLVGQLVVFLWMRYRRDEQITYERVEIDDKDGLPPYEDVPAAHATTEKEIEATA